MKTTLLIVVEGIISMAFIKGQEYVFLCACTVPLKLSGSRWVKWVLGDVQVPETWRDLPMSA